MTRFGFIAFACVFAASPMLSDSSAHAQPTIVMCNSQQALEQVVNSNGQLTPDGCRNVSVTPVQNPNGRLCVLGFAPAQGGLLQKLSDSVMPDSWWVQCDKFEEVAR
jgi:hypothetical protein